MKFVHPPCRPRILGRALVHALAGLWLGSMNPGPLAAAPTPTAATTRATRRELAPAPATTPAAAAATHSTFPPFKVPHKPNPAVEHVLIISVDGLRPDVLLRLNSAATRHIRSLFRDGAYTFWARTTVMAVTLPSHTSMLTGVVPRRHEIEWNKDLPFPADQRVYPTFPTLFEVAKAYGYTTGMAAGKSKFDLFDKPEQPPEGVRPAERAALDYQWYPPPPDRKLRRDGTAEDAEVAEHAADMIVRHAPAVMFVHLPSVDNVGHADGWGTPQQEQAVREADQAVGRLLEALDEAGVRDSTFILLTADHGGAGFTHLAGDERARHIPWIANGPGVRKGMDLATYQNVTVNTEDTFCTACHVLGIPLRRKNTGGRGDRGPDGEVHLEIFEGYHETVQEELMHSLP